VRMPLALLGDPEKLFLTAEGKAGDVAFEVLPWVALDLSGTS